MPPLSSDQINLLLATVAMSDNETMTRIRRFMAPQAASYRAQVIERLASMIASIASAEQYP